MKKVKEIMSTNCIFCTPLDNVFEAAVKMKESNADAVLIVENDQLAGIITDRDLVTKGIAEKRPGSTKITDVMNDDVVTITPDASAEDAAEMLAAHHIHHLPVVEDGKVVGIITERCFT
ncbi:MAG: CBS domain-containing protein [Bacillaceae bacterium]|uniref:CBS domain-containing protein n=1 Tax=Aeribacillus composti TaxID=1868734 RepID=A0ABY9W6V3_9BACI|nr:MULTISPECIES: CBS domain-containing protein [Aeribacillus]REJ20423.1 MAG: CBS domain-containing protein [Bacillaceae bacterium]MED1439827.1 CBS domain-containing protein [Aeribacillus composti]REJ24151.1 MAG: CBS domain-containing protein [Bacillaceae bacterium]WNF31894.1 CBS domain-containing protein [Aeribacillus composti]BBU39945.1 CBS domain-containing protein [Aeribacillus pallidus]